MEKKLKKKNCNFKTEELLGSQAGMKVEFDRYEDIFYTKVKYIGQQKFRALETKNMAETYPMLQVFL
jgi:hypothetical protein